MPATPTTELGNVATWAQLGGWPYDPAEETPELLWPQSIHVYDRMRRQDAQIRAILHAITLPLRRPIWAVDPAGADPAIAAEVAEDLDLPVLGKERTRPPRTAGRFSWSEHLRMALLALSYGHMPFEQVYDVVDGKARLRKLAPRFPATLVAVNVAADGGLVSIEQYSPLATGPRNDKGLITIPADRLVFYSIDREGGSWQGNSILRPSYKHWLLKDRLIRVQAQAIERNGMGVPTINAPEGATQAQIDEYSRMAQGYRAGEYSGGGLPFGAKLTLNGVQGTLPDALPAIEYHDTAIARSVLAQFLQLGTGSSSGNRALGGVFVDFFTAALDSLAGQVADTVTQHVVEDIVDLNYGPSVPAPKIVVRPVDGESDLPVESLGILIERGAITVDDDLETFLRSRYRMPARNLAQPARVPPATPSAAPVAAGRRVAASAPGSAPYAEKLTSYYKPKIAKAMEGATDPAAIVAALEES